MTEAANFVHVEDLNNPPDKVPYITYGSGGYQDNIGPELIKALAKAQSQFPDIPKNKTVVVTMDSGGKYTFKYADLDSIINATRGPLTENGLAVTQNVAYDPTGAKDANNGVRMLLYTWIMHSSGQYMRHETPAVFVKAKNANQAMGSMTTYAQRRGMRTALVIATDEDEDGNSADGNDAKITKDSPPAKRGRPPVKKAAKPVAKDAEPLIDQDQVRELLKALGQASWTEAQTFEGVAKIAGIAKPDAERLNPTQWQEYLAQLNLDQAEKLFALINDSDIINDQ